MDDLKFIPSHVDSEKDQNVKVFDVFYKSFTNDMFSAENRFLYIPEKITQIKKARFLLRKRTVNLVCYTLYRFIIIL